MALTTRKDILNDLMYRMGLINVANGYSADVVTVARHRDTGEEPFDLSEVPALNVKDGRCTVTRENSQDVHAMEVRLEIVTSSRISADGVEDLIGDVHRVIRENPCWGSYADNTNPGAHDVDLVQAGETITSGIIDIVIMYSTDHWKA